MTIKSVSEFSEGYCKVNPRELSWKVPSRTLYEKYLEFCKASRLVGKNRQEFVKQVAEVTGLSPKTIRINGRPLWGYMGISLEDNEMNKEILKGYIVRLVSEEEEAMTAEACNEVSSLEEVEKAYPVQFKKPATFTLSKETIEAGWDGKTLGTALVALVVIAGAVGQIQKGNPQADIKQIFAEAARSSTEVSNPSYNSSSTKILIDKLQNQHPAGQISPITC